MTNRMSIIQSDLGWFINHQQQIDDIYQDGLLTTTDDGSPDSGSSARECYRINPDFFNVHEQFRMESQHEKFMKEQDMSSAERENVRRRKKKRKLSLNEGEAKAIEFHQKVVDILKKALTQLLVAARTRAQLVDVVDGRVKTNNSVARTAARDTVGPLTPLESLCDAAHDRLTVRHAGCLDHRSQVDVSDVINTLTYVNSDVPTMSCLGGENYLFPPNCGFLMSHSSCLEPLMAAGPFDLILLDPPWQNKAVKRKRGYSMVRDDDLLSLPIQTLGAPGALVVVWATNKQSQHVFLREQLFRRWRVKPLAQWYWLKVTQEGEVVCDLDNSFKKPYECLFLGRLAGEEHSDSPKPGERGVRESAGDNPGDPETRQRESSGSDLDPASRSRRESDSNVSHQTVIPDNGVLLSVPCSVHSWKPGLHDVLSQYVPRKARCLEMFARNLQPGWTSWGNEVLLHQHVDFFRREPSSS